MMDGVVFSLDDGQTTYAFEGGDWCVRTSNGAMARLKEKPYAFLELLEVSSSDLNEAFTDGSPEAECLKQLLVAICQCSVTSSEYWQELALERMSDFADKQLFCVTIKKLAREGASQAIRHRAKKLEAHLRPFSD